MSFGFNKSLCNSRKNVHKDKMPELTPDLYQELLRFNAQEISYFNNPISLSKFIEINDKKVAYNS